MIILSKRQEAILYYSLEGTESVTIKKLASRYQLSERMIHYDLDYIKSWLKERGNDLKNTKNGIIIEISEEKRHEILAELFQDDVTKKLLTKPERLEYTHHKILLADNIVTSDEIVDDLEVSKPTVLSSIKEVETLLAKHELFLKRKRGAGYWVDGKEINIRKHLVQTLLKALLKNDIHNYEHLKEEIQQLSDNSFGNYSLILDYIRSVDTEPIYQLLNLLRKENNILISDIDSFELFIYVMVMVKRLQNNHYLKQEDISILKKEENTRGYILGRGICEQLEDDYGIRCNKAEINCMVLTLIGCNVVFLQHKDINVTTALDTTIELMLEELKGYEYVTINSEQMRDLKSELGQYLTTLLRKRKLHLQTENPLLAQMKAEYTQLFEEASRMADIFYRQEGILLSQEEIGLLTVYIAVYADDNKEKSKKTAVIVSNEGIGLSKLLLNRIKNNIPDLYIKSQLSVYQIHQKPQMLKGVDFIISTVPLPNITLPVFCVSPIISVLDIRKISDYIVGNKSIQLAVGNQKRESYLKDVIIGILAKYMENSQLSKVQHELNYFLNASSNLVSTENSKLIREEYAYKVSMVIVKLSDMFRRIQEATGKEVEMDTMTGLAIHVVMSVSRWEDKEFYQEKGGSVNKDNMETIHQIVDKFLEDVSETLGYPIAKWEAVAIMRYLI